MSEDRVKNSKAASTKTQQIESLPCSAADGPDKKGTPSRHETRGPAKHRRPVIKTRDRGGEDPTPTDNGLRTRSVAINRNAINEEKRTVELSFSSETAQVTTYSWELGGWVPEILLHTDEAVDLGPLRDAGSVLHNHNSNEPVAIPLDLSIDAAEKKGRAVIHFPEDDPDSERAWNKVRKGLLRGVSVGFSIDATEEVKHGKKSASGYEGPAVIATRWTVHEISLTAVPADASVGVGRHKPGKTPTKRKENATMNPIKVACESNGLDAAFADKLIAEGLEWERDKDKILERIKAEVKARAKAAKGRTGKGTKARMDDDDDGEGRGEGDDDDPDGEGRGEDDDEGDDRNRKPKKRSRSRNTAEVVRDTLAAERKREREIRSRCRTAGLTEDFADDLVSQGVSVDAAARSILDEMQRSDVAPASGGGHIGFGADQADKHMRHLTVNLGRRALSGVGEGYVETDETRQVEHAHMTLQDCVRTYLEVIDTPGARFMSPTNMWREYFRHETRARAADKFRAAGNTSADLSNALSNLQSKSLMMGFKAVRQTWRAWARKGNLKDFKPSPAVQLTDFAQFRETLENGEILESRLSDRAENRQLAIYGRSISLTLQMFINDDLDALGRLPAMIGKSAGNLPGRLIYTHLLANPTMSDGNSYFDNSNHANNPSGASTALDSSNKVTAMKTAIQTFRKMTAPQAPQESDEFAAEHIDIEPRVLLVTPEDEYHALSLVNPNMHTADSGAGTWAGKFQVEVEPRLSNANYTGYSTTAWYLAAAAGEADTAEVSFLDGNEAPVIDHFDDPRALAVLTRAWLACGVKMLDWRSMVKVKGAA